MTALVRMPTCMLCGTQIATRCRTCLGWYCWDCTITPTPSTCEHKLYDPPPRNDEWDVPPPKPSAGPSFFHWGPRPYDGDGGVPWEGPRDGPWPDYDEADVYGEYIVVDPEKPA